MSLSFAPVRSAPTIFDSVDGGNTTVTIGNSTSQIWAALRKIYIPNVREGQVFIISGKGQVANNQSEGIEFVQVVSASPTDLGNTTDSTVFDYWIPVEADATSSPGEGIDIYFSDNHYFNWTTGSIPYIVPAGMTQLYITAWCRCRAVTSGSTADISTSQQWLQALRLN